MYSCKLVKFPIYPFVSNVALESFSFLYTAILRVYSKEFGFLESHIGEQIFFEGIDIKGGIFRGVYRKLPQNIKKLSNLPYSNHKNTPNMSEQIICNSQKKKHISTDLICINYK